jgi:rhodanese-related sulfurtransferase
MKKLISIIASLLLVTSCSSNSSGVTNMNVSEFSKKITESGVVILDVRTPGEFAEGFIEGAQNIDFQSENFENEIAALDKKATYAIYCRSGNRSGQAAKIMHDAGFHDVYNLDGGVIDWANEGMTLVQNQ